MQELFGKTVFPKLYANIEKKRQTAKSNPLKMDEINTLLSMRFNNEPVFGSIDLFYSEEYKKGIDEGKTSTELEGIVKFRHATDRETNLIYSDLHARNEKEKYIGSSSPSDS
jgi:hypothetical protein